MAWPKGTPRTRSANVEREPIRKSPRMRMAKDWEAETYNAETESFDRLHIPLDVIKQIEAEDGVTLQWVTTAVRGQPEPQMRARFEKTGWRAIYPEDFGGVFDGHFTPRGSQKEIEVDGLTLMARPKAYSEAAEKRDLRRAHEQVRIKEQSWKTGGGMGVAGADHPSAVNFNHITKTTEPMAIPKDE